MANPLTPRQARFCIEYLVDLNATQAAIRSGYAEKGAYVRGAELLRNRKVAAEIARRRGRREERTEITQDMVLTELARVAFSDPRAVMTWGPDGVVLKRSDGLTDAQAAIVAEVGQTVNRDGGSMKVKLHDKLRALDLLGRHLGMFGEAGRFVETPPETIRTEAEVIAEHEARKQK